jgi:PAS domain S-box-containing protein
MNSVEFQLRGVGDPRLAVHATSSLPVWLWSTDGTRIRWANPVGASLFGARNAAALATKKFGPADQHRRQVAQLSGRLPAAEAVRLERLRGFGAPLASLVTCACMRLEFSDGSAGILIAAAAPIGRGMPLVERLQRLVEGADVPIAAFARDGMFLGASDAARTLLGFHNLLDAGLDIARGNALRDGRVETPVGIGHMVLQRVGTGADIGLIALLAPGPVHGHAPDASPLLSAPATLSETPVEMEHATTEQPAWTSEPAEFPVAEVDPELTNPSPVQAIAGIDSVDHITHVDHIAAAEHTARDELIAHAHADTTANESASTHDEVASNEISPAENRAAEEEIERAIEYSIAHQITEPVMVSQQEAAMPSHDEAFVHFPPAYMDVAEPTPTDDEIATHEPSPFIEAVADEPLSDEIGAAAGEQAAILEPQPAAAAPSTETAVAQHNSVDPAAPSWFDEPQLRTRRHPLRFMWQMDIDGRFALGSDEFTRLIGARTAAAFGRLWTDIADSFGLDPQGRVLAAVATHETWSGITLNWPADGGAHLPVELSGLPIYDRARNFAGYRGFGVCRDLDGLEQLAARRRHEFFSDPPSPVPLTADIVQAGPADDLPVEPDTSPPRLTDIDEAAITRIPDDNKPDTQVEPPKNVVPFRPPTDLKSPALTPVENNAFNELARQLSARLDAETVLTTDTPPDAEPEVESFGATNEPAATHEETAAVAERPDWLVTPPAPPRGEILRDKTLLDLMPVGVLIYRLDRLLYANAAFLSRIGHDSLHGLEEAGGLDALYVEPDVSSTSSTSDGGTAVTISATEASVDQAARAPAEARLFTIAWDGEPAHALIFSVPHAAPQPAPVVAEAVVAEPAVIEEPVAVVSEPAEPAPAVAGHADAEDLAAILDTTAEGIVMFDADGRIHSCNRSAEALFGYDGAEMTERSLANLFALESQRAVQDYLDSVKSTGVASLLDHGREALGRVREGGFIPLSMTMGRTRPDGPNFFAVFRDLSQTKTTETELLQARRQADRAATAKADVLARISHEVRTPLNAIIGFAEVMIDQRFGTLGNERYVEYMKDIRASGERVLAIVNDMLDLSRIETGKLDLAFAALNLNEVVEQCVAVMQPQANRGRIIIRTSLAHLLPTVVADARALRQITLNLIGSSIHLANAGGQVIVSTALSDFGEVVLRVRDTGHGLNDNELAAALEPFRTPAPTDQASDSSGFSLSLTKALVEANRAKFQIKTAPHSGTLIEVVFAHATAKV